MEIGQKLKEKRTALGLSQEQLAEQLGITRQTIANWEKGKTYPDIASVLKLSDLYCVSLDELLKEDAVMRKHVEESAALPRKYWNMLFELAILLNPFGMLVAYWGAQWLGLGMQILGIVMLPPLWVARHKLFGMSQEDMKNSIMGWAMYVAAILLNVVTDNLAVEIAASTMQIYGFVKICTHGIYLERGTRFWLVIFLYVGIPLNVFGSLFLGQLDETGAFIKDQPFGHSYAITSVELGEAPEELPVIELDHRAELSIGDERVWGQFEYAKPAPYQEDSLKGIWYLLPEKGPGDSEKLDGQLYRLEVTADDQVLLTYLESEQPQWCWELEWIPGMWFSLNNGQFNSASEMDWFSDGTYTGDPATVNYTTLSGTGTAHLQLGDMVGAEVDALTVKEEYHHGDQVEYREYFLNKDKNDHYPLPEDALTKRYDDADQYILYRVQWEGGEFLFRLKFH